MVRITVLASGSRGNCTVFSTSRGSLLLDAGLSCRETLKRMRLAGEDPGRLQAIVVSHEHSDHVYGLEVLGDRLGIPLYITEPTYQAWRKSLQDAGRRRQEAGGRRQELPAPTCLQPAASRSSGSHQAGNHDPAPTDYSEGLGVAMKELRIAHFSAGQSFNVADIDILPFTTPHDAADPVGFVLWAEGMKIAMVTDLGYLPGSVCQHLRGCDGLLIESNHDLEMLRGGSYPWMVKQRVMSRVGHLSNHALAEFFLNDYDGGAAFLVLAHLSEQNNHPEIARASAEKALGGRRDLLRNRLMLAMQGQPLESIKL